MSLTGVRIFALGGVLSGSLFGLMLSPFSFPNGPTFYAVACGFVLIASVLGPWLRRP